ncbi:MAG: hypothetical protein HBSIN02_24180 [Bacteroidia bacterium]|nr:MAG: hypothetical protein HBSIN02_24180 [Bacteroidia bacterium]
MGNSCADNAVAESVLHDYIEVFYYRQRKFHYSIIPLYHYSNQRHNTLAFLLTFQDIPIRIVH